MKHWHWTPDHIDCNELVAGCYRPDIYRQALSEAAMPEDNINSEHLALL